MHSGGVEPAISFLSMRKLRTLEVGMHAAVVLNVCSFGRCILDCKLAILYSGGQLHSSLRMSEGSPVPSDRLRGWMGPADTTSREDVT